MTKLPPFDDMLKMSPEALQVLKEIMVEEIIDSAPEEKQQRLMGLQFTLDGIIQTSANPMQACVRISQLMHESLQKLDRVYKGEWEYRPKCSVIGEIGNANI